MRLEQDSTLFVALGNDHEGFINSNAPNISLLGGLAHEILQELRGQ